VSPWLFPVFLVAAYLVGSIPFGLLIGLARGVDIRRHGSRNIGATNCGRVCGAPWGVLAFVLDVGKGFGPTLLAVSVMKGLQWHESDRFIWTGVMLIALGPILGHVFPVYLKFRGGKAVATSLGVVLALPGLWPIALLAFGVWILAVLISGYVSVGSTVATLVFLGGYLVTCRDVAWGSALPVTFFVLALVTVVIVRHRTNYARLLQGEENRIWGRRPTKPAGTDQGPALDQDASLPTPRKEPAPEDTSEK